METVLGPRWCPSSVVVGHLLAGVRGGADLVGAGVGRNRNYERSEGPESGCGEWGTRWKTGEIHDPLKFKSG